MLYFRLPFFLQSNHHVHEHMAQTFVMLCLDEPRCIPISSGCLWGHTSYAADADSRCCSIPQGTLLTCCRIPQGTPMTCYSIPQGTLMTCCSIPQGTLMTYYSTGHTNDMLQHTTGHPITWRHGGGCVARLQAL